MKKYRIVQSGKAINKRGQKVNIQPIKNIDKNIGRILSMTDHPNITFFDYFKDGSTLYIASEDLSTNSLKEVINQSIRSKKYFSEEEVLNYFSQILSAIKHCHDRNIVHGDLKPENIFITDKGDIKIGNFQIFKKESKKTDSPYYESPELLNINQFYDKKK